MQMSGAIIPGEHGWNESSGKTYLNQGYPWNHRRNSGRIHRKCTDKRTLLPFFNFEVPTELRVPDPAILDPRDTYASGAAEWRPRRKDTAQRFVKNFAKYEG